MLSEPPLPLPSPHPPESESKSDYYVPSVKKQKVNSEDGESSDLEPLTLTDDEIYIEDKFYEEELRIKDTASWERYLQQIRESEIKRKWVGENLLLGVQTQGHARCWAFATSGAITAIDSIDSLKRKRKVIPLSKQQLVDCMLKYYPMPEVESTLGEGETFGLPFHMAFKFAEEKGIVEEEKYHYIMQRSKCKCPKNAKVVKIDQYQKLNIDKMTKEQIESRISKQPVACVIPSFASFKRHLGQEVYLGPTDEEIIERKVKSNRGEKLSYHAVHIEGYGIEKNEEFYLIQNSWEEKWGYEGFAKIKCSLVLEMAYPVIKEENKE